MKCDYSMWMNAYNTIDKKSCTRVSKMYHVILTYEITEHKISIRTALVMVRNIVFSNGKSDNYTQDISNECCY